MTAIRQGATLLFDSRAGDARRAAREARMQPHNAILIEGAAGGLEIIAVDEKSSPEAQLEARAKRLYKGQRASLITYYKNQTVER
ncbi:hypothetical protein [Caulobacter phage BL94]|nr:hypothetical protein [Caulobacter phage BL94]